MTATADDILRAATSNFAPYRGKIPPFERSELLWGEGCLGIWLADNWGPAVPYPPIDHGDGTQNFGYRPVKGDARSIAVIPEIQGWPEYQKFLEILNAVDSPIETVGCEKHLYPAPHDGPPGATRTLGSYTDIIYSNAQLNDLPVNILRLASTLATAVIGCEQWWGDISFALQRFKFVRGATAPWGLSLYVKNYGRDEDECRKYWSESIARIGKAATKLPADFGRADIA